MNRLKLDEHPDAIRRAQLRELASRWIRFIRFIELQRRIDAGEPVLRLIRPDAEAQ